jgi:ABC-2 type transport system permease protein
MKLKENLRIVSAITAKDITDAIKNKIVQGVLIGVAFMVLSSQALALLVGLKDEPTAFFWDQGKSPAIKEIVRSRELNLYPREDLVDLKDSVSRSVEPVIGIVIPVDFDERIAKGKLIYLQAYYPRRIAAESINEVVNYFKSELNARTGTGIVIEIAGNQIYPPAQSSGYPMMVALGIVLGVMTIGLVLTPYLIVDEKENHTLDAILVSPARTGHLLISKSLVGLFYSLIASTLIFILSWRWIVHWDIVLLAVFLGGLSAVSVGLLVGALFDAPTNVNMFVGLLLAFFLVPMYLWTSLATKLSPFLQTLVLALPSVAMYKLVGLSFTETPPTSSIGINLLILLAWIFITLGLIAWRIRRLDR